MIVALLNQKGGVGKPRSPRTSPASLAMRDQHVVLLDADPQGSSLDWTQRRSQQGLPRLFSAVGLARETLHQEAPELARRADHVVIDGPPRIAALARSALLAAERVLIPVQPSPYDLWASAEMVALIREAQVPACAARGLRHQSARQYRDRARSAPGARRPAASCAARGSASAHRVRRQRGRWPACTRDGAGQRRRPRNHRTGGRTAAVADMTANPPPNSKRTAKRVGIARVRPRIRTPRRGFARATPMRWARATSTPPA